MTGPAMGVPEVIASPGRPRPARPHGRRSALIKEATATAAAVVAGFVLAVTTVPAAPTPQRVAASFVQALFDQNWPAARTVLCRSDRDRLDHDTFTRALAVLNEGAPMPSDIDLEVRDPQPARGGTGAQITVKITATSDDLNREDWAITGDVPLLVEDGRMRVCFTSGTANR